jgi:hypothetical protein
MGLGARSHPSGRSLLPGFFPGLWQPGHQVLTNTPPHKADHFQHHLLDGSEEAWGTCGLCDQIFPTVPWLPYSFSMPLPTWAFVLVESYCPVHCKWKRPVWLIGVEQWAPPARSAWLYMTALVGVVLKYNTGQVPDTWEVAIGRMAVQDKMLARPHFSQ